MNNDQFIYWLKGFSSAIEIQPTERQWDTIVSELEKIKDCPNYGSPIDEGGWGTPNTTPLWQEPHYPNQLDKYKITCDTGVVSTNGNTGAIITDGFIQNASVTRANPPSTLTTTTNKNVVYTLDKEK